MTGKSWTKIDKKLTECLLLSDDDYCFYYLVRVPGGFSASEANSRIEDFKKAPERFKDNPGVWKYKIEQIEAFAQDVVSLLGETDFGLMMEQVGDVAIVPMPTHYPKGDPKHDSRLRDMCEIVARAVDVVRVEDVFDMRSTVTPSHFGGSRDVAVLKSKMRLDGFGRTPGLVILVDDVITTGSHYVACREMLQDRYPSLPVIGLFLAIHQSAYVNYGGVKF